VRRIFVFAFCTILCVALHYGDAKAIGVEECKDSLIRDTYSNTNSSFLDWRLAEFVSESAYSATQREGGVGAKIFGIPIGADYSDFRENIRRYQDRTTESLTAIQASNIMWTGLKGGGTAYKACLDALVRRTSGLHLTISDATESDITLRVSWNASDAMALNYPEFISLSWSGATAFPDDTLPRILKKSGSNIVRLKRPLVESSVVVNATGLAGDSVTLTPLPTPVPPPCIGLETARTRFETAGDLSSNNFSIIVPECGFFVLKAHLSDYNFDQTSAPVGPDLPPTPHTIRVTHTLCVQQLVDANGPFVRIHVNRGCGTTQNLPNPEVFYRRSVSPGFSDESVSNWNDIRSTILVD